MTYKRVEHEGRIFYGQQLLLDAHGCAIELRRLSAIVEFLRVMPTRVGMRPYGSPIVERFGEGEEVGFSGVQLLYNSAVVLHTNEKYLDLYLDVFSCRNFDIDVAISEVRSTFRPEAISHKCLYRQ